MTEELIKVYTELDDAQTELCWALQHGTAEEVLAANTEVLELTQRFDSMVKETYS